MDEKTELEVYEEEGTLDAETETAFAEQLNKEGE